ncbi:hypothetical protein JCM15457_2538 [Liquorilactobacillus sucicola DSM 21376 = JCM 15457]|uniref:Uncharacterized protein n=1 Tax=Liquorilactobacillus sucicola DSM 21376 = JCM 15457 TaxID=1423806 RepID=A0A023D127_9LACO|nr:hypothetical protein FD15_GL002282 [Liquorilactobacillus sucicola DSM 21376 = JCM 15457]GAJ27536.1 hypothetical protein JCM15457_2538 [Liquorilactobacillus sucicola DSM 21376 = JCM 15457]
MGGEKLDSIEIAKNNLKIIKNKEEMKKILGMNVTINKNIKLLRPILITLNKEMIKNSISGITKNNVIKINATEIIRRQNKNTRSKLIDKDKNGHIKGDKVRNLIKLLCTAGTVRKVGKADLTTSKVKEINNARKEQSAKDFYKSIPVYYEILDIKNADFTRLQGFNENTKLKYAAIFDMYGKTIADNTFNRVYGDNKKTEEGVQGIEYLKNMLMIKEVYSLSEVVEKISKFAIVPMLKDSWKNVHTGKEKKSSTWWRDYFKSLSSKYLSDNNLKICMAGKLKKDMKKSTDFRTSTLVITSM